MLTIYCKQVVTTVWNHLQTDTNSDVSHVMITIRRSLQVDKKSSNKRQLNISKVQMWLECKKIHTGSRWNVTKTERDIESISTINSDSKKRQKSIQKIVFRILYKAKNDHYWFNQILGLTIQACEKHLITFAILSEYKQGELEATKVLLKTSYSSKKPFWKVSVLKIRLTQASTMSSQKDFTPRTVNV